MKAAELNRCQARLQPCPFCNGPARVLPPLGRMMGWSAECTGYQCGGRISDKASPDEAVDAWNVRAASLGGLLDALKPCPFCNGPARMARPLVGGPGWYVGCDDHRCGGRIWAQPSRDAAASIWNKRGHHESA